MFVTSFGYFAHGVDESTAVLPEGWEARLVRIASPALGGATGWCLEPHDLVVSKLAAGREKDLTFAQVMVERKLVRPDVLRQRLDATPRITSHARGLALARLTEWAGA